MIRATWSQITCMYYTIARVHAVRHPLTLLMNIIKWVCYFSQGCATVVYASAILSLLPRAHIMNSWLYHRGNSRSSLRPIVHFAEELQCFVCDRATPLIIEKMRSKVVAMHAYGVSVYYAYTGSQLNGPGWSRSK